MDSVTLFELKTEDIRISIVAYFEKGTLVVDGYDIGRTVKEYWGDSDYEYLIKIPDAGVEFLYSHFSIWRGDQQSLLNELARRFNTNTCYSDIQKLLDDHNIKYEGFTWA
ncbi:MAG TPA: hypothetical protein PLR06_11285 [Cyclobacteriaceae bacterium]|nr:hypothetical protein [Cyclobacteriaceae bacterium]